MMKLKRSECAILPLVLKGRWYEMIASGEKREEYRDDTPYWRTRISNWLTGKVTGLGFCVVAFSRGYRKPGLWFWVDAIHYPNSPYRKAPRPDWGEPETPHFSIVLGKRVELEGVK